MDLGAVVINGYSAFTKAPVLLEPHYQIVLYHMQDTHYGSFTPRQRCIRSILQPQSTGLSATSAVSVLEFIAESHL